MDHRQIGGLIFRLRKEQGLTQRQLAEALGVSEQAVRKWERGLGCPDVSLLPPLAKQFGVGVERLLAGELESADPDGGNMKRLKFYVCPDCGNVLTATAAGELHCCGRKLEPLAARPVDGAHSVHVEEVEEDWYVTFAHPMRKDHYLRFAAWVGTERLLLVRLYPEQGSEFRIPQMRGGGKLYLCCSRDGLFQLSL